MSAAEELAYQQSLVDRPRYCLTLDVDGTLCRFTVSKNPNQFTPHELEQLKDVARELMARGQVQP